MIDVWRDRLRLLKPQTGVLDAVWNRSAESVTAVRNLDQDVMHNVSSDIRQPEIATAVEICQAGVIQTHQVEHGGVKIVNMRLLLHGLIPKIISGAVRYASLDSSTGEQDRKPSLLWLRPFWTLLRPATSVHGRRPNSPPMITKVSFKRPELLRSSSKAAIG